MLNCRWGMLTTVVPDLGQVDGSAASTSLSLVLAALQVELTQLCPRA